MQQSMVALRSSLLDWKKTASMVVDGFSQIAAASGSIVFLSGKYGFEYSSVGSADGQAKPAISVRAGSVKLTHTGQK